VWDAKLAETGEDLAAYRALSTRSDAAATVDARYDAPWRDSGLAAALAGIRTEELRRGVNLVGPHRDELALTVAGRPARTHASQGEQRCLALALRLATHAVVTDVTGSAPVLLLDDVFSELDPDRSDALLANLPSGQTVLTSAVGLPLRAVPDLVLRVAGASVAVEAA
jgi:DNA replication and repair protein RecF